MSGVNLPLPCEAYTGNEPFAFVSYAHSDAVEVYPEILRLHDMGYRVWFDEGIDPGNEWPEEIASAIQKAALFIVFVSDQAVQSHNVRNEINFALALRKPFLAVHMVETLLPPGMALQMSSIQAILKWRMSEDLYLRKLERVLPRTIGEAVISGTDVLDVIPSPHVGKKKESEPAMRSPDSRAKVQKVKPATGITNKTSTFAGIEFIWCSPGAFMMGSPSTETDRSPDEIQHQVTLTRGFWMGKYEVTQAQWESVMGTNPSYFKGKDLPVEQVSWDDVQAFLTKLNQQGKGAFRLPTEAEWEYACRAGTTTAFCFGDAPAQLGDYAWYNQNSGGQTHPVGQKRPNAWGLYDMHGNVYEWCQDWFGDYPIGAVTDPPGSTSGSDRVNRGGGWNYSPGGCRSAIRYWNSPGYRSHLPGVPPGRFARSSLRCPFHYSEQRKIRGTVAMPPARRVGARRSSGLADRPELQGSGDGSPQLNFF